VNPRRFRFFERPPRLGEGDRCPVCGATSGVSGHPGAYRCLVCGAPRVLVDGIVQRRGTEKPLLLLAKSLWLRRATYAVVAALALAFGIVSLTFSSVVALIFGAAGAKGLFFAFASLLPLVTALGFFLAARRTSRRMNETLSEAQLIVAKELIASGSARDAAALAQLMHLPAGRAEEMFGQAEVERMLDPSGGIPIERVRVQSDEAEDAVENSTLSRERSRR
jgi:hypothetical protein